MQWTAKESVNSVKKRLAVLVVERICEVDPLKPEVLVVERICEMDPLKPEVLVVERICEMDPLKPGAKEATEW